MGLLDLPPEFFANVMRLCADKDNVCGVSKQRVTCKTIKYFLDHKLFARMPVRAFTRAESKTARTLLKSLLLSKDTQVLFESIVKSMRRRHCPGKFKCML
ncbi:hypothetical protein CUC08_Gglean004321 [Alternaria sp. MG1]|nr:hypothetical protein CUC08_Gglean004321 [Alternaria sp. MG1]